MEYLHFLTRVGGFRYGFIPLWPVCGWIVCAHCGAEINQMQPFRSDHLQTSSPLESTFVLWPY